MMKIWYLEYTSYIHTWQTLLNCSKISLEPPPTAWCSLGMFTYAMKRITGWKTSSNATFYWFAGVPCYWGHSMTPTPNNALFFEGNPHKRPNYPRFSHQVAKGGQQQGIGATEEITQANSQKSQRTWKLTTHPEGLPGGKWMNGILDHWVRL